MTSIFNSISRRRLATFAALATLSVLLSGCGGDDTSGAASAPAPVATKTTPMVNVDQLLADVDAGKPISPQFVGTEVQTRAAAMGAPFITRTDPFGLLRQESAYERSQRAERLVEDTGGFLTFVQPPTPPPATPPTVQMEPQPYRRLSGILVGDTVLAIMEFEDGTSIIVRPGTVIPGTNWTVVSLDTDKAVLRRPGNVRPTMIVVPLENPRAGGGGGGTGGGTGGTGGGTTGGGRKGGPGGEGGGRGGGNVGGGL